MATDADTMRYVETFNTKMEDFLADISELVKVNPAIAGEVNALKASIKLLSTTAKGLWEGTADRTQRNVIDMFNKLVAKPYGDKILTGDEDFFLHKSYDGEVSCNRTIVDSIKGMWVSLVPEDKEAVKKHMKLLVMLTKKVFPDTE